MSNPILVEQSNHELILIERPSHVYDKYEFKGKTFYPHQFNLMGQVYFVYNPNPQRLGTHQRINTRNALMQRFHS